jgi:integrase
MPRRRKDYRVAPSPEPLIGNPGALVVDMIGTDGALERSFDFGLFDSRPMMAAELALAFRHHCADKGPKTRLNTYHRLSLWFRFLAEHHGSVTAMRDVDTAVLRSFIAWLDAKPWMKGTRHGVWSCIKQLVAWLRRNRPDLVHPDLEIPFNAFPRKNAEVKQRDALSRAEMERVLAAARTDIETNWAWFQEGQMALAQVDRVTIAASKGLGRLDLDDLGVLLAVVVDRFAGIPPQQKTILCKGAGLSRLHFAFLRHGGVRAVAARLYAIPDTIIPYMIAIGAQTYANPDSLRLLRRDCMSEHLLLDGRVLVTWQKGRANREQRRSFLRDKSFSVPNLIEQALALTAALVPHAPAGDRNRLFLIDNMNSSRTVGVVPDYLASSLTRRFVARHKLLDDRERPLELTLAALRASGLTLAHERLGHDILKTQALANHATPDTTQRYVDRPLIRQAQVAAIGRLQARFVDLVRGGDEINGTEPPAIDARRATASGFICRDPLSGAAEGQRAGQLCTAWLGCFTCPNAVIPLDADVLVRLNATRAALIDARSRMAPDRWQLLYAPKLEILERDILPRFPSALHGAVAARPLPTLPPIE